MQYFCVSWRVKVIPCHVVSRFFRKMTPGISGSPGRLPGVLKPVFFWQNCPWDFWFLIIGARGPLQFLRGPQPPMPSCSIYERVRLSNSLCWGTESLGTLILVLVSKSWYHDPGTRLGTGAWYQASCHVPNFVCHAVYYLSCQYAPCHAVS